MRRVPAKVAGYAFVAVVVVVVAYGLTGWFFGVMCESDCTDDEASGSWAWAVLIGLPVMLAVVAIGESGASRGPDSR